MFFRLRCAQRGISRFRLASVLALSLLAACAPAATPEAGSLPTLAVLPSLTPSVTPGAAPTATHTPPATATTPYYAALGTVIGAIASDATLSGAFNQDDERHIYTFEGRGGTYVSLRMGRVSGSVDPALALYGPDGSALAGDDNSGGSRSAALRSIRLPADGVYSLQAWGRAPGRYQISLLSSAGPIPVTPTVFVQPSATPFSEILTPTVAFAFSGERLEDHVLVLGRISSPGGFGRHAFEAGAGEVLTIGARPVEGSALRPVIEVYDPEGALVSTAQPEPNGDSLIAVWRAPSAGIYGVFVTDAGDSTGDYSLSYGRGPSREDVRRGLLPADETISGQIERPGAREVWSLALNPGDVITAAVQPGNNRLDPALELTSASGAILSMDDDSGGDGAALIASALIPVSGVYHLRVTAEDGVSTGPYTIAWFYINLAPSPTPPPAVIPVLLFDDTVVEGQYQFFPFQGEAGDTVRIVVTARPGSPLDPTAALLAPDGSIVAEGDDSPTDLNPRFSATLPADGTYLVRVSGYLSRGAFTVSVDRLAAP